MGNVYKDHKDTIVEDLVNEAIGRLKNARGPQQHGYHDRSKPSLDYSAGSPAPIKKPSESTTRIRIDLPE
jgi:hypothetical protein